MDVIGCPFCGASVRVDRLGCEDCGAPIAVRMEITRGGVTKTQHLIFDLGQETEKEKT